jgi:hypothetical protein
VVDQFQWLLLQATHTSLSSFGRSDIRRLGELPEQIRQPINRRHQKTHGSLKRRMFAGARVAARRHKRLCRAETRRELFTLTLERCFEANEVVFLFALDVLREGTPDLLERGDVVGVGGTHLLEDFEAFFDPEGGSVRFGWREGVTCRRTNHSVLLAIVFSHLFAFFAEILLERRVDDQLLCDGVAGQFPGELVAEALLVVMVAGVVDRLVVVLSQLSMVLLDGVGKTHWISGHGVECTVESCWCTSNADG